MKESNSPNLYNYEDYRKYLSDWVDWMRDSNNSFSYRAFSKWAGFKSPNQLLLVIKGERNISISSVNKYVKVLKLKENEARYFELLVKFNQAEDMPTRTRYFKDLSSYWIKKGELLEKTQYKYLSSWYYPAIRELVNLASFKEDGAWISKKLNGFITSAQARKAIEVLLELKLLKRDENGKLAQTSGYVTTGNQTIEVAAYLYHEQMIRFAMEALKKREHSERNITSLIFTMRKKDYEQIVEKINQFRKEIISLLENREDLDKDESLYHLNFHLFPIDKR